MYRFFVEPSQIKDNQICISGSDVNHIKNVLRMKLKEEILISSGEDKEYTCYIEEIGEEEILAHIMYVQEAALALFNSGKKTDAPVIQNLFVSGAPQK